MQTPYRAPNCNAHAERFVRSIKEECLDRLVFLGESHLRRTLMEFAAHYRHEGERAVQRETSRFVRVGGRWYYLSGVVSG